MAKKRTTKVAVEKVDQRTRIVQLRVQGYSFSEIGEMIGISKVRAYQIIQEYIQQYRKEHAESIEDMVELDCQRIDSLMRALWGRFNDGETNAAALILKCIERRAKMLGIDAVEDPREDVIVKAYKVFDLEKEFPPPTIVESRLER